MEKEFNYGDGIVCEVRRIAEEKGYKLTKDQIEDVAYDICHDDEINNLVDSRIEQALKKTLI